MALIQCDECGGKVSDRAAACPHCGTPPGVLVECYECGDKVSDRAESCPHCGAPTRTAEPLEVVRREIATWDQGLRSHGDYAEDDLADQATTADKILCFFVPILWFVVRFLGGRVGAGPYALGGLAIGFFLSAAGAC